MKTIISGLVIVAVLSSACSTGTSSHNDGNSQHVAANRENYTCPMHPQVVQDKPGQCPVCGMELVPVGSTSQGEGLMLSDTQMRLANITTQRVGYEPFGKTIVATAQLLEDETKTQVISSRIEGRVERLHIKETGIAITTGTPLYELYTETLMTLQQEYLLAKEQSDALSHTAPRYANFLKAAERKLLLYGLSNKQIDALAESKKADPRVTFYAKASGIVTAISIAQGQYVQEGTTLFSITDNRELWAEAALYASDGNILKRGDNVQVSIAGYEHQPITAAVTFVSPEYRSGSQVYVVRAAIPNPELQFRAGMHAQVLIRSSEKNALTVPVDAVIRDQHGAHLYVVSGRKTFSPRMVKTGNEDFDKVEIIEGLHEGDTIAASGAYLLYSENILKRGITPTAVHNH